MASCYGCKKKYEKKIKLVNHLKEGCHFIEGGNVKKFKCGELGCSHEYYCDNSFYKHLIRQHKFGKESDSYDSSSSIVLSKPQIFERPSSILSSHVQTDDTYQADSYESLILLLSSLYANPLLPRNCIQPLMKDFECCFRKLNMSIASKIIKNISVTYNINPNLLESEFSKTISSTLDPFKELQSEHKRMKLFEKMGSLISPIQISIGSRRDYRQNEIHMVPCTIQVVPLNLVLSRFLAIHGIFDEILTYIKELEKYDDPIENLMQGISWKQTLRNNKSNNNELHLPLILYFDDLEVNNPLGSHASIHKLGATYVSLPFLPKKYFSLLNCILMLSICHSSYRVVLGDKMIFTKVIETLNDLSENGINISTQSFQGVIKFHTCCITGDNLSLNGILGYLESFSANYCCRFCTASKESMQTILVEDLSLLRTSENYAEDLLKNDSSKTGIKEKSIWFDLKCFDLFNNVAVDFLHDFLEGVCRYTMSFVVSHLVNSKLVSYSSLQSRIVSFDYGPDNSAKPVNALLKEGSIVKIKTSAAEMLTLVRYMPRIAGPYVVTDDEIWDLLLTLRELLDKLLSPRIDKSTLEQARGLIRDFLLSYKTVTKKPLTPKFHFLIHYPGVMEKYGPLSQLWTMRFEAKHKVSKIAARTSTNRVNICKTVANRNQLTLNNLFLKKNPFVLFECGKKTTLKKSTKETIIANFPLVGTHTMYSVKWIKKNGYGVDIQTSILTLDLCLETGYPVLARVLKIYLTTSNQIILKCLSLPCSSFSDHFYAYAVDYLSTHVLYVHYDQIHIPISNTITIMPDFKAYVTVRPIND